eukprot:Skav216841  [mRNA]  locus=scaffold2788:35049:36037:+ [translate_table: standard]
MRTAPLRGRGLIAAAAAVYVSTIAWAFCTASKLPSQNFRDQRASLMRRHAVKFMSKKRANYAKINVEDFYAETVSGAGGPPKGIERDLITKFFGDGDFHGRGDHEAAFKNFKECMEKGEPFVGKDDGSGWIWAVAGLNVEKGLSLEIHKSTPLGMRALLVAKQGKVADMFDTLNWKTVRPESLQQRIGFVRGFVFLLEGWLQSW